MNTLRRLFIENTIVQYSIIMFLMVATTATILATSLSRKITDYMIESHIEQYPNIVSVIASHNSSISDFFQKSGKGIHPNEAKKLFEGFQKIGDVFRIKVWNLNGIVIWSDRADIIGEDYSDNSHFIKARSGLIDYDLGEPHHDEDDFSSHEKNEHTSEQTKERILEIYTPVVSNNQVIGVLELYEADEDLYASIEESIRFVWYFMGITGLILYILQFFIFYQSYQKLRRINHQVRETQSVTLSALADLAETRDNETGKHLDRTAQYVKLLASALQNNSEYATYLSDEYIRHLTISAPLHDIGKVGVPDQILQTPGKLTEDDFELMKKHCKYGADTLINAENKLSFRSFLKIAIQLTSSHHEKWNGMGYPKGFKGDEIPLSARIMCLADVYDALRTERVYKKTFSHEKSKQIILDDSGTHFDPKIVEAFLEMEKEFEKTSNELSD